MEKLVKVCGGFLKGLDAKGEGVARIAGIGPPPDKDLDILQPGCCGEQVVPLLTSHDWSAVPVGKARVFEGSGELLAAFKINMGMDRGRELHAALRFDLDNPPARQEWSFGFRIPAEGGAERGTFAGRPVRFLKRLELLEVSPVVAGAGVNTRTVALKADQDLAARMRAAEQAFYAGMERRLKTLKPLGDAPPRGLTFEQMAALLYRHGVGR